MLNRLFCYWSYGSFGHSISTRSIDWEMTSQYRYPSLGSWICVLRKSSGWYKVVVIKALVPPAINGCNVDENIELNKWRCSLRYHLAKNFFAHLVDILSYLKIDKKINSLCQKRDFLRKKGTIKLTKILMIAHSSVSCSPWWFIEFDLLLIENGSFDLPKETFSILWFRA